MRKHLADTNIRPDADQELLAIAQYVAHYQIDCEEAYATAHHCLMDAIGCAVLALQFPDCSRHLGPWVAGTTVPDGARVPGTDYVLDPVKAAWDIGVMVRWLDYNDTWLAAEWGHPSDNLGGILAVADYLSRRNIAANAAPLTVDDVLTAMIKAYEIQGVLALENSFNEVGLDHVVLVKVATTAVITAMLGGGETQIVEALSHAWVDGQSLRTYRHAPNTSARKSWAAGDASSRGVQLAMMACRGESGLPSPLSAQKWGFYDVLFKGRRFAINRSFGSYVMENILFKPSFPAEFHAQTAVEAAFMLHEQVRARINEIRRIVVSTQESAIRIISKDGPLHNPADRDHCLQYMIAVGLIHGELTAEHYQDNFATDEQRIDLLRSKMEVVEDKRYSREYLEPEKRSIANAVQVFFMDGTCTDKVEVEYPLGHRRRRAEALPQLHRKFISNLQSRYEPKRSEAIFDLCKDQQRLAATTVNEFCDLLASNLRRHPS